MGVTYSTTQQCWSDAVGNDTVPSSTTLPTSTAIDGFRDKAKAKIKKVIGSHTDVNDIANTIERDLVKIQINNVIYKTNFFYELTQAQVDDLVFGVLDSDDLPIGSYQPNQDG